jgi:hypothetical protein
MSGSSSQQGPGGGEAGQTRYRETSAAPDRAHSTDNQQGDLLAQVVHETLRALEQDMQRREGRGERESLRQLRGRHRDAPLTLDPIVIEMVEALLEGRFASVPRQATFRQQAARWIAESLWEDPEARQRLHALWEQLREGGE